MTLSDVRAPGWFMAEFCEERFFDAYRSAPSLRGFSVSGLCPYPDAAGEGMKLLTIDRRSEVCSLALPLTER